VEPLLGSAEAGAAFGSAQLLATLKANWLNGVAKADQKAAAKSLIRQGLTPVNAERLAKATGVDPAELRALAGRIRDGQNLTPQEINVLGRFDAVVSAVLDLGYERGDQLYRNAAKIAAAVTAIVLAVVGGGVIYYHNCGIDLGYSHNCGADLGGYLASNDLLLAILVGAISTPLAPVAKDLSSSLQAAVKAVGAVKRYRQ
jgi:hypothetical protein